jgi:hypothetical protein
MSGSPTIVDRLAIQRCAFESPKPADQRLDDCAEWLILLMQFSVAEADGMDAAAAGVELNT